MQKIKKSKLFNKWILVILSIFLFIGTVTVGFISVGRSEVINPNNFGVDDITFLESGSDGKWTISNRTLKGEVTGEDADGCFSSDKPKSSKLTLTYGGTVNATAKFSYEVIAQDGDAQIDGDEKTGSDTFEKKLSPNDSIIFYIKSNNSNKTTLNITNFQLQTDAPLTLTLIPQENGVFTFNNTLINEETTHQVNPNESFTLNATPNSDYDFIAWYFNGQQFSRNNPLTTTYDTNAEIYPLFVSKNEALFSCNNVIYFDLQKAADDANKSSGEPIIELIKSGSIEGNRIYNIYGNTRLFIPRGDKTSPIYDESIISEKDYGVVKEYLNLTLNANTSINFNNNSILYLGGMYKTGQPSSATITGGYGQIILSDSTSTINLNDSSKLYCYGYITGEGIVNANNGTNVYEIFQIASWRGGTWTLGNYNNSEKVFIINQYYIQNVECRLRIYKGANIIVSSGTTMSIVGTVTTSTTFLGDSGIFMLEEGYIERQYDYINDRVSYTVLGKAKVSSISLKVSIVTLDSANCFLPINNNFTINVLSGSEITIGQDVCLLPGAVLNIEDGAFLRFNDNTSLIVYDNDNWFGNSYAYDGLDIVLNSYSATLKSRPNRILTASSPDAEINLNGEMILNNGAAIYTTIIKDSNGNYQSGGANIHSSNGTGKITFTQGLGTETVTYQVADGAGSFEEIPIVPSYLKNGENADEEYFIPNNVEGGVVNKTIVFDMNTDSWSLKDSIAKTYKLIYVDENNGNSYESTYTVNKEFALPTSEDLNFYFNNYSIKKWEIPSLGVYNPGTSISLGDLGELEIYAIYGGWINDNQDKYYIDYNSGEYLKGLNRVDRLDNQSTIIALFDENNGLFLESYNGIYNDTATDKTYFLEFGIVKVDEGLISYQKESDLGTNLYNYLYITSDNSLLTNGTYYIEAKNGNVLPSGYYSFDENGYIIKEDTDTSNYNKEVYINNINEQGDATYIDGIRVSVGLFTYNGHYYYSDAYGYIVKNKTYYVSKVNDTGIKEGLYYFDEEGRMYDESFNLVEVNS